jgi:hypothetical protein
MTYNSEECNIYWSERSSAHFKGLSKDKQTLAVCLASIKISPWTIQYVKKPTLYLSLFALNLQHTVLPFIRRRFREECVDYMRRRKILHCLLTGGKPIWLKYASTYSGRPFYWF